MTAQLNCTQYELPAFGLIRVQGTEARSFLQGQLTNDINLVSPEQAQLSAWCNPKGRMLAIFLIFEQDGSLYLKLPLERLPATLKRLRMFVMRSDVQLSDASQELVGTGLVGCIPDAPPTAYACQTSPGLSLIRMPGADGRILAIGTDGQIAKLRRCEAMCNKVESSAWALADIRAGMPQVYDATAEAFVPQMLNLDLIPAISFTKGCYTGQEVVARTKYLGQVKRRMFHASFDSEQMPAIGTELHSASSQSAQGAGKLVDVAPVAPGRFEALVMAEISSAVAGDLKIGDENGTSLQTKPLFEE